MQWHRARTSPDRGPGCERNCRRAPCRNSGKRLWLRRHCDLRSPYCAPSPCCSCGAAGMRGPCSKREGCFKIITGTVRYRCNGLLRRVHPGTAVFARRVLLRFTRRDRLGVLFLLGARTFALAAAAHFTYARFHFVNEPEVIVVADDGRRGHRQLAFHVKPDRARTEVREAQIRKANAGEIESERDREEGHRGGHHETRFGKAANPGHESGPLPGLKSRHGGVA